MTVHFSSEVIAKGFSALTWQINFKNFSNPHTKLKEIGLICAIFIELWQKGLYFS